MRVISSLAGELSSIGHCVKWSLLEVFNCTYYWPNKETAIGWLVAKLSVHSIQWLTDYQTKLQATVSHFAYLSSYRSFLVWSEVVRATLPPLSSSSTCLPVTEVTSPQTTMMSGLAQKWIKSVPKWNRIAAFQNRFQYVLAHVLMMFLWKSRICPICGQSDHVGAELDILDRSQGHSWGQSIPLSCFT